MKLNERDRRHSVLWLALLVSMAVAVAATGSDIESRVYESDLRN